ncbi:MAG: DUF2892 domain-containing protein [Cyclobacteriaceae bacterium]|nr:DUF2892 domain-containing protein [Cyclobacteriaceae bacterium HetDA_MAG_MS6]
MMNRFVKGLSYTFDRNLGFEDRVIRVVLAVAVLVSWFFGVIDGVVGTVLGVLAIMILGTAASARCGVTYWMNANTMGKTEKKRLDDKNISYE